MIERILLTLMVGTSLTGAAAAQEAPPTPEAPAAALEPVELTEAEALAQDAAIYSRAYDVSLDEAMRRLLVMHDSADQVASIERGNSDKVAGMAFVNRGEFSLRVHSTSAMSAPGELRRRGRPMKVGKPRRELAATNRAARVKIDDATVAKAEAAIAADSAAPVRVVANAKANRGQLQSQLKRELPRLEALPGFEFATLDESIGGILVMFNGDPATQPEREAEVAAILSAPFTVNFAPGGFKDVAIYGGMTVQELGQTFCMTGFSAIRSSDQKSGVITAAHCATPNQITIRDSGGSTYNLTQGLKKQDNFGDIMFLSGTPTATAQFRYDSTGSLRTVTGTRSRSATAVSNGTISSPGTTIGSFVCHLGQDYNRSTYHVQSCGEVIATGSPSGYNDTDKTSGGYVLVRNTQSGAGTVRSTGYGTLKCFRGDSGGPWFANTIAFGVTAQCNWWDGAETIAMWAKYTSVDLFHYIGVTIRM